MLSIHPQWLVVAAFVSLALETPTLQAQEVPPAPPATGEGPTYTVTGTVIAEATHQPLPYSTVVFDPIGRERFTDQGGSFTYFAVPAGKYKVRIRQLGYTPLDTTIVVTAATTNMLFRLDRVPSTLEDVQVSAPVRRCIVPEENGFVDDAELAIVLAEARKNAQRENLLRRTYPFEYKLAQQHDTYDTQASTHKIVYDTTTFRSDDSWRYRQGKVVSGDFSKVFGDVRVMRLPTLTDLADTRFLVAHCFKYSGISEEDSTPTYRIDFAPLPEIASPDVEGSIFIDSASYLIRRAEFRLTKGGSVKPAILGMKVTTTYREVLPNVALFDEIKSVQPLPPAATGPNKEFRETQQLLSFRFLFGGPPGVDPSLVWRKPVVQYNAPATSSVKRPVGPER
ncbi:MAG: carboxypeptidase-like regulatory domain-containing protein [Gemmatimonadaceae bacterium]